ncbi:MAG: L-seryl-tRNA(Sec) selenium transferase [Oscillospiraceae bacterium]|jgi:L-seryl-tRNA(Ser) seleniumtransferase|nr:L-seryl-tRNA(Sec) selenium transferase [Oscillospiraceae bacterium]
MDGNLRELPNMNALLEHGDFSGLARPRVKRAAQSVLSELRAALLLGTVSEIPSLDECAEMVRRELDKAETANLRGVINATGIILHTNLGRAPLGDELYSAAAQVYRGYSNLEYDLETGQRGSRYSHIESLVCELTGAEAAMVVNNNAAAVFIMLTTLASGKRVAISRGELVEIGGSFRIPEIMEQSGAQLIEVGATNKTRLADYSRAVSNGAEILLKVHTSNYEIVGFTESVSVAELAAFGHERGLPVLYDMGSCFVLDPERFGFRGGETARGGIEAGADIICFSGDKLLGSMQGGIMAGRREYIAAIKKHPLARVLRADKLTLAALETTLRLCLYPEEARERIPTLAMLFAETEELKSRATTLAERLRAACPEWTVEACAVTDETGGGSLPNVHLSGWAVALEPTGFSVQELERRLRRGRVPVIIRISGGAALISVRTLLAGEDETVAEAVRRVYEGGGA